MADRILARRHDHAVHAGPFGGAHAGAPALQRASGTIDLLLIRPDGCVAMKVMIRHSGPGPNPVNDAPLKRRTSPEAHTMHRPHKADRLAGSPKAHAMRRPHKADRLAGQW